MYNVYFMKPVTQRIETIGIHLGEYFRKNYIKEVYGNPVSLEETQLAPCLKGVALQSYIDIKNDSFEPLSLLQNTITASDYYNKLKKKYIDSNLIFKNEKQLINFCYLYSDLEGRARCGLLFDFLKVKKISEADRDLIQKLAENTYRFMNYKNFEIKYRELGFNYKDIIENDDIGIINNTCYGDLDFITNKNTILDIKCYKRNQITKGLAQQFTYYMLGVKGKNSLNIDNDYFKSIDEVGLYNPVLDNYIYLKISDLNDEFKNKLFYRIIDYPLNYAIDKRLYTIRDKNVTVY